VTPLLILTILHPDPVVIQSSEQDVQVCGHVAVENSGIDGCNLTDYLIACRRAYLFSASHATDPFQNCVNGHIRPVDQHFMGNGHRASALQGVGKNNIGQRKAAISHQVGEGQWIAVVRMIRPGNGLSGAILRQCDRC